MEAPRFSVVDNGSVIFMALAMAGLDRSPTHPMPSSTDTPHSIQPISQVAHIRLTLASVGLLRLVASKQSSREAATRF